MRFAAFFVDQTWQGQHKMEKTQHARTEAALEAFLESPEFENRPVLAIGARYACVRRHLLRRNRS
jgi:hypothetical protein